MGREFAEMKRNERKARHARSLSLSMGLTLGGNVPSLLAQATAQLNGIAPYHYWDFINNRALFAQADVGGVSGTPGWSFTRASTGYAETVAGVLVPFASGELRRTDKGVLIEGARANLLLQSQTFDNASWGKASVTISANAATAPDGTTTADKQIVDNAASIGSFVGILQSLSKAASAIAYTYSVFAKAAEFNEIALRAQDSAGITNRATVSVNIATGAVTSAAAVAGTFTSASATVTALANGWYLVALTFTSSTDTFLRCYANADDTTATTGDGVSGIFIWGAQLEAASFASSYIPTTTASATRAADVLTVSNPGVNYPLSLFGEFERVVDTDQTGEWPLAVYLNAGGNYAATGIISISSDRPRGVIITSGATQMDATIFTSYPVGSIPKLALRVEANNSLLACAGALGTTDTSVTVPTNPDRIGLGNLGGPGSQTLFGYLRRAAIFNSALSDADLQLVTIANVAALQINDRAGSLILDRAGNTILTRV